MKITIDGEAACQISSFGMPILENVNLLKSKAQMTPCKRTRRSAHPTSLTADSHIPQVWIDVLIGSDSSVDLCHVAEKGAPKKKAKKQCAGKKRKAIVASSQVESEYDLELESEDEDIDQQDPSQTRTQEEPMNRKPACDSDDFTPSSMKKRRVEVLLPRCTT